MAAFGRRNDPPATPAISFPPGMGALPGTAPGSGPTIPPPTAADTAMFPAPTPPTVGWSATPAPYAPVAYAPPGYAATPMVSSGPSQSTVIVSCVLAAIVGLACLGSGAVAAWSENRRGVDFGAPVTMPASVGGHRVVHTPEVDQAIAAGSAEQTAKGVRGAQTLAYGTDGAVAYLLTSARRPSGDDTAEEFLSGVEQGIDASGAQRIGVSSTHTIAGQAYRCQQLRVRDLPVEAWGCTWISSQTVGLLFAYNPVNVIDVARAAADARQSIESADG